MADFSSLSDTDESAVKEIVSEVADQISLQQISTINLDAQFRRLKTFPPSQTLPEPDTKSADSTSSASRSNSWMEAKLSPEWKSAGGGFRSGSVSPPMSGCLCCSPRTKISRKRSFRVGRLNDDVLGKLGDGSMSRRNQEKIMMKAVKEEIAREAEKFVELARHASARMNSHA